MRWCLHSVKAPSAVAPAQQQHSSPWGPERARKRARISTPPAKQVRGNSSSRDIRAALFDVRAAEVVEGDGDSVGREPLLPITSINGAAGFDTSSQVGLGFTDSVAPPLLIQRATHAAVVAAQRAFRGSIAHDGANPPPMACILVKIALAPCTSSMSPGSDATVPNDAPSDSLYPPEQRLVFSSKPRSETAAPPVRCVSNPQSQPF
jgi:hypothetical protein